MGFINSKRPWNLRTKASTDLKFDVAHGTTGGYVATPQYRRLGINTSTAASTALSSRGVIELGTSSTTAAANYILSVPAAAGEELTLVVKLHGSTFGVTVNASTATLVTFGAVAATTDQIRMTMPGILGTAAQLVSLSTARWLVVNHNGCSFSTVAA